MIIILYYFKKWKMTGMSRDISIVANEEEIETEKTDTGGQDIQEEETPEIGQTHMIDIIEMSVETEVDIIPILEDTIAEAGIIKKKLI